MTEVYNIRIGDLIWNQLDDANIIGLVYKMTPKYVYYAVCARNKGNKDGNHYITKDNKVRKDRLYEAIRTNHVGISYAQGTNRRRKIKKNTEGG
tara:strand:+ start:426 stop:707 length:282 start_codon:yes stop_codon:yes gene_type:complete